MSNEDKIRGMIERLDRIVNRISKRIDRLEEKQYGFSPVTIAPKRDRGAARAKMAAYTAQYIARDSKTDRG